MNNRKMQIVTNTNATKGITLIALIITIIIMLILVAVTITTAINGELFEKAGEAVGKTQNAINQEQQLINDIIEQYFGNSTGGDTGEVTLPEELKVGDYVNYTPDTGTYKVADGAAGSGIDATETGYQEFTTETGTNALKWRVLSINEQTKEIELVSATAGPSLTLKGTDGYNHTVDILNDLCESLYSKTKNGTKVATGRSINVEDINAKTAFDYKTYSGSGTIYGTIKALSNYGTDYRKYPNLYERETGYAPGGTAQIGLSESQGLEDGIIDADGVTTYSTVTGYTDDYNSSTGSSKKDIYYTYTYYFYYPENNLNTSLEINTAPSGLINLSLDYWLASRCIYETSNGASFNVRFISTKGAVESDWLTGSDDWPNNPCYAVRPVVTLNPNVSLTKDTTNSSDSITYWNIKF